jgi:hypothetical protein
VVPSLITGSVIVGNTEAGVMVNGAIPDMLNTIVFRPAAPFALIIACRKDPAPVSLPFMTVYVAAARDPP